MKLNDTLEILLPTYNRRPHLERTLTQLTAEDSPVRGCNITVLDNASTDGTSELIEEFVAKYTNIKHIRHSKNIGGNGNIARAFELATFPYVWVVCDDDSFKWDSWAEIQTALDTNNYDLLLTRKDDLYGTSDIAKIVRQCTFLPAGIYRSSVISSGVLMNMLNNIPNMFPHLAMVCEILNRKGKIFLPQGEIMDKCTFDEKKSGDGSYTRGSDTYVPQTMQNMFWTVGYFNSLQMIQDPTLRAYCYDHAGRHGFFGYIWGSFKKNYTRYHGYALNEAIVKSGLNCRQKFLFSIACVLLRILCLFSKKK